MRWWLAVVLAAGWVWGQPAAVKERAARARSEAAARAARDQARGDELFRRFVPRDGWRVVNGVTNWAKGGEWEQFAGVVMGVHEEGVRLKGWHGRPGGWVATERREFLVSNFPYEVADGDRLGWEGCWTARRAGTFRYSTFLGGVQTLHRLDYGVPAGMAGTNGVSREEVQRAQKGKG